MDELLPTGRGCGFRASSAAPAGESEAARRHAQGRIARRLDGEAPDGSGAGQPIAAPLQERRDQISEITADLEAERERYVSIRDRSRKLSSDTFVCTAPKARAVIVAYALFGVTGPNRSVLIESVASSSSRAYESRTSEPAVDIHRADRFNTRPGAQRRRSSYALCSADG